MDSILHKITVAAGWIPLDLVIKAPNLKWLQLWFAGTDWQSRYPKVPEKDFTLANGPGIHAIPISEHILLLMLVFSRGVYFSFKAPGGWLSYNVKSEKVMFFLFKVTFFLRDSVKYKEIERVNIWE